MRILLALAVVIVFAALMIFDTTALLRLFGACVTGGCGVSVRWIAIVGGVLVLAALLSWRRTNAKVKKPRVKKVGRPQPARGKATARRKPKPTAR
jgi:hypothetical protein